MEAIMKTVKKMLLMSLVLLVSIGTLFAAGGGQGGRTASGGGTKTIEFWHIQNVDPAPKFIGDAVKRFEAANPEYKVDIIITANDSYKQKIAEPPLPVRFRMFLCPGQAA
jgi:ABC-type glycerol-3-phosphate transport system substrate-binding protein